MASACYTRSQESSCAQTVSYVQSNLWFYSSDEAGWLFNRCCRNVLLNPFCQF